MCGGAILADFIPAQRSRRLTADFLWPDLKKSPGDHSKGQAESEAVMDNNFEVDFRDFKDEVDNDFEVDFGDFEVDFRDFKDEVDADVEPFAFSATASKPQHHRDGDSAAKALPFSAAASETRLHRSKL